MTRDEAYSLVTTLIKNPNLIKHHLAAEAAMKEIALDLKAKRYPTVDVEDWSLVGLLHDADYELCKDKPEEHTLLLEEKIKELVKPEIMHAIKSHAYSLNKVEPKNIMDWAIYTCDELTGFIIACALVRPDKKLSNLTVDSILKRMKESSFAKAVDRNQIKMCEEKLSIPLNEFIETVLRGMQKISGELGL
ncbi:phosphohydrolase [Candidatus Microgenomates bacterium]|nr:MAG: phosphohydrolase [Candidatus Microgenomates bacterium]